MPRVPPAMRSMAPFALLAAVACQESKVAPKEAAKSPPPPSTVALWVSASSALRYRNCADLSRPIERFAIGTRIEVVDEAAKPFEGRTLRRLADGGCIDEAQTSKTKPAYGEALAAAHAHLKAGDLVGAAEDARRAELLDAGARTPLEIQRAIFDAEKDVEGAQRVYRALRKLPAAKERSTSVEAKSQEKGVDVGRAHVAATILNVRRAAKRGADVVFTLRINDVVDVVSLDGDWARVTHTPPAKVRMLTLEQAQTIAPKATVEGVDRADEEDTDAAKKIEGWVATRFLQKVALTVADQVQRADAHEKADRVDLAMKHLERAARLERTNTALLERLIDLAIGVRRYGPAVWAAKSLRARALGGEIEVDVAVGCRAPPTGAWVDEDEAAAGAEAACVTDVDLKEICEPMYLGPPQEIEFETTEAWEAAVKAYEGTKQAEEDEEENDELRAAFDEKQDARASRLAKFDDYETPTLRARIFGRADARGLGTRLFVYSFDTHSSTQCDVGYASGHVTIYPVPLAWPDEGEVLTVYAELPEYAGHVHGVLSAASVEAALERLRETSEDGRALEPNSAGVFVRTEHTACAVPCGC